jgi:hypothetical protein
MEVIAVPDVLVRGLSADALERIDAEAAALGLSRNEFLRRKLEVNSAPATSKTSLADLRRAAAAAGDLLDPTVMDSAWR